MAKSMPSKYEIAVSDKLGRYLVASKDLSAGEVILRDQAVAVGPTSLGTKIVVCFSCMRQICEFDHYKKIKRYQCSKCRVAPLCNVLCENFDHHHTVEECQLFQQCKEAADGNHLQEILQILLTLRTWLLKDKNPEIWEKVISMESHIAERRNTAVWEDREVNVINVLRSLQLVSDSEDSDSSELLQQICGILDVNTFELRSLEGVDGTLRGLYTEAAKLAHDCRGNTHLTVDEKFDLTIYASVPIAKGEIIYFNYTSSLLGSAERREHLREGKYFNCQCSMCEDPFEKGSNLSSLLCTKCKKGYMGMDQPFDANNDPYAHGVKWKCESCGKLISGRSVKVALDIAKDCIEQVDDFDLKGLEKLLKSLLRTFHTNHYYLISLKQKLLTIYRRELASVNAQKRSLLRMIELCKEILQVLEIVEPGISRLKGIIMYEMHLPLALLANREYNAREISSQELAKRLRESSNLLKDSLKMLLLEPVSTPEGQLAKRGLQELKLLNQNIADVEALPAELRNKQHKKNKKKNK